MRMLNSIERRCLCATILTDPERQFKVLVEARMGVRQVPVRFLCGIFHSRGGAELYRDLCSQNPVGKPDSGNADGQAACADRAAEPCDIGHHFCQELDGKPISVQMRACKDRFVPESPDD